MRQSDFAAMAPKLCTLAREAGLSILKVYEAAAASSARGLVAFKTDQSPLTEADLAANQVICAGLAQLTPDIPVVSEEHDGSLAHRCPTGEFWLVDPLDGTKEFLARNGEFTVNIALVRDAEPVWGVVYAPVLDLMYWGGRELGAFRAQAGCTEPIRVSSALAQGERLRVVASKSHLTPETSRFIEALGSAEIVQAGSSLKFCRIAEGSADVYPRLAPTCEWDTAAAQAVVEGAGGHVRDLQGERLRYGKPDVLNPHFVASSVRMDRRAPA
jgi:3'(2'), 5'-bisphosphate nucleotidase